MPLKEGSIIRTSLLDSQSKENPSNTTSIKPLKFTAYALAKHPSVFSDSKTEVSSHIDLSQQLH